MLEAILGVLLGFAPWHGDRGVTAAERRALAEPVAQAIVIAAQSSEERAFLAIQADEETAMARLVLLERCSEMPEGLRCDGGRSRGPWQVKRWCRGAWDAELTREERFIEGARCALRKYRLGRRRCGTIEGGFAVQKKSGLCAATWAQQRAKRAERLMSRL